MQSNQLILFGSILCTPRGEPAELADARAAYKRVGPAAQPPELCGLPFAPSQEPEND